MKVLTVTHVPTGETRAVHVGQNTPLESFEVSNRFVTKCWEFPVKVAGLTIFTVAHWTDSNKDARIDGPEVWWEVFGVLGDESTAKVEGVWTVQNHVTGDLVQLNGPVVNGAGTTVWRSAAPPVRHVFLPVPTPWEQPWHDTEPRAWAPGSSGAIHGPHAESVALIAGLNAESYQDALDANLDVTYRSRRVHYLGPDNEPTRYHASSGYPDEGINVNAPDVTPVWGSGFQDNATSIDGQHAFRPIRHMAAWQTTGSRAEQRAALSFLCALGSHKLLNTDHPKYQAGRFEDNQRWLGWMLRCFSYGVSLFDYAWMRAAMVDLVDMVEHQMDPAYLRSIVGPTADVGRGVVNGMHFLTLNQAGLNDGSHAHCRIHGFQTAVLADALLRSGDVFVSDELKDHCVLVMRDFVIPGSDGPTGRFWKDMDPTGPDGQTGQPRRSNGYGGSSVGGGTEKWMYPPACAAIERSGIMPGSPVDFETSSEVLAAGGDLLVNMHAAWNQTLHMRPGNTYFDGSILAACWPVMQRLPGT